jgi:ArsR family transcriptional regulator
MPAPVREVILAPEATRVRISAEPTLNALNTLLMFTRHEDLSGLDPWVEKAMARLTQRELDKNILVMLGLYFAVIPTRSWPSFPDYIDHLEALEPLALRDRVLDMYLSLPYCNEGEADADKDAILSSEEAFLAFLRSRFPEESIIEPVERQAFKLLSDPVQMRKVIVDHFRAMWTKLLAAEWGRIEPLILESVEAFRSIELSQYDDTEIGQLITGKDPGELEKLVELMGHADHITFVPSVHNGPYMMQFFREGVLWVLFGARVPEGLRQGHTALSRAEFIVWLSALADDTRLQMLTLIKERGELCAQEIIDELNLSQSTASRHLRQLAASGFLQSRRIEAGKCYNLNPDRFQEIIRELERFSANGNVGKN